VRFGRDRDGAGPVVYLIHFETPFRHARHYTGWTAGDLDARLAQHRAGAGARLMAVITQAGIDRTLARCVGTAAARVREGTASRRARTAVGYLAAMRWSAASMTVERSLRSRS
jgi:hypothetical protein